MDYFKILKCKRMRDQDSHRLTKNAKGVRSQKRALRPIMADIGFVHYHWNSIHQNFMLIWAILLNLEAQTAKTIWHSIESDRTQRGLLKAAIAVNSDSELLTQLKKIADWLDHKGQALRNGATHAPLKFEPEETGYEVRPDVNGGSKNAKTLSGKEGANSLPTSMANLNAGFERISTHVALLHHNLKAGKTASPRLPPWPKL